MRAHRRDAEQRRRRRLRGRRARRELRTRSACANEDHGPARACCSTSLTTPSSPRWTRSRRSTSFRARRCAARRRRRRAFRRHSRRLGEPSRRASCASSKELPPLPPRRASAARALPSSIRGGAAPSRPARQLATPPVVYARSAGRCPRKWLKLKRARVCRRRRARRAQNGDDSGSSCAVAVDIAWQVTFVINAAPRKAGDRAHSRRTTPGARAPPLGDARLPGGARGAARGRRRRAQARRRHLERRPQAAPRLAVRACASDGSRRSAGRRSPTARGTNLADLCERDYAQSGDGCRARRRSLRDARPALEPRSRPRSANK